MAARFQFSIRFLLAAMAAVAAGVAVVRYEGPLQTKALPASCVTLLYATAAVVGVMRTSGKLRTFWVGTALLLVPSSFHAVDLTYYFLVSMHRGDVGLESYQSPEAFWPLWCAAPINGLFAVAIHWLFSPRRESDRLRVAAMPAVVLLTLVAAFFGGMRVGEFRERYRRNREEQTKVEEAMDDSDPDVDAAPGE